MRARSLQDFDRPAFDRVLPHLTPTRQAILRAIYAPEERSVAFREDILEALPDAAGEAAFESELEVLEAWGLAEEAGRAGRRTVSGDTVTSRRFALTDRGDDLMDDYGDELGDHYVTREERSADEWLEYPVPLEHKVVELAEEVALLRAQVGTGNAAAGD